MTSSVARRSAVLFVGGVLLLLAAVAHGLGFAQFDDGLAAAPADTRAALHVGWLWGSATFAALGVIVLGAVRHWRRHGRDPRAAVAPAAVALVVFGAAAFVARDCNPHFLGFVALGLVLGLPLLGAGRLASTPNG